MIRVIARQRHPSHLLTMAFLVRWMTLIAFLLMPIGMANASVPTVPAEPVASAHCQHDAQPEKAPKGGMDCGLTCSAILPELIMFPHTPLFESCQGQVAPATLMRLAEPEIATPPPRFH